MKKILFLSSAFIMTTIGAYAADGIITGGAGTCTVDVLGVSDNNATANTIATWSLNDYKCGAGQYLDEDTLTCTTCPAGSYCPGGTFTIENASSGTFDCPAGYTESASGAGTNNECYTACTVANANIAHATAVTGNDYYGTTDADTCTATDCELGYHVESDLEFYEKTPLVPVDYREYSHGAVITGKGERRESSMLSVAEAGLTENNTWARQYNNGIVYGRASCQPEPGINNMTVAAMALAIVFAAGGALPLDELVNNIEPVYGPLITREVLELVDKLKNNLIEDADLFNRVYALFGIEKNADYRTDSTGKYCFCQVTGFKPTDGEKYEVLNAPWVSEGGELTSCADSCVLSCINYFVLEENETDMDHAMAGAMYGSFEYVYSGSGMCKITENNCPAGQYLAIVGDAMMCVPCKSGSYCPGGVYTIESENKGTNACPAGYAQSDEGASANTQCYTACTLDTANIAHATAVSGNDYYGTGTDTCTATACDTGYHVKGNITVFEKEPLVDVDYLLLGDGSIGFGGIDAKGEGDFYFDNDNDVEAKDILTGNNTWGHVFNEGIVYGRASCQPTLDPGLVYIDNIYSVINGSMTMAEFRAGFEPIVGKVKADFVEDLFARAMSGAISMDEAQAEIYAVFNTFKDADFKTTDVGQYCHCQIDGFAEFTGEPALENLGAKTPVSSAPWIYLDYYSTSDVCSSRCAFNCSGDTQSYLWDNSVTNRILRTTLYGALDYTEETSICAANTINIDWNPDNGGAHTQNMCTYDGAITLPDEPVKVGYTFSGWKLVEPNSTPVQ